MLVHWLRLLRVGTLLSPAADVVAGACAAGLAWTPELARATAAGVCIYAAGMVLNDHADRALDARQRPERPIPAGHVRPRSALAAGIGLLIAGVALSPWWPWHAALAFGVLAYDYLLKRRPGLAAIGMGALRGANLLAGVATVAQDVPSQPMLLGLAAGYAAYIAAVTVLGTFEDERLVEPRAVVAVQAVPPIATIIVLLTLPQRWPGLAIGLAFAIWFTARVRGRGTRWDRAAIRRSMTWLLLGTMVFTALVCLGSARPYEAAAIGLAIPIARTVARRIALT